VNWVSLFEQSVHTRVAAQPAIEVAYPVDPGAKGVVVREQGSVLTLATQRKAPSTM
jgi:hypothetical protein